MNILRKAYTTKYVLSVRVQMVFQCLACLVQEKDKYKVCACFFENTYDFKNCFESCIKYIFRLFFTLVDNFSSVHYVSEQFLGSQTANRVTGFWYE
jgi:hypothetical protein